MKASQEKIELEKLLDNSIDKIDANVPKHGDVPELRGEPLFAEDFKEIQNKCDKQAKKLIHTVTGFVLSDDIVQNNPYLKDKIQTDLISLSGILYQLKINELMQKTLMEEIRHGVSHPRMFEVFGQLSKTISEINKQLLQTIEVIKNTFKDIKQDVRDKDNELRALHEGSNGLLRNEKGTVAIGTKDLIKSMKSLRISNEENKDDIEDIKIVE